jgi:hypothetical protein
MNQEYVDLWLAGQCGLGLGEILKKINCSPAILAQMYLAVKLNFRNILQNTFLIQGHFDM